MEAFTRPMFGLIGALLVAFMAISVISNPTWLFELMGNFAHSAWTFVTSGGR